MAESQAAAPSERLKVFVSYSRSDLDFADQLVLALEDKGFDALVDRHDIDAAEKWKDRLGALIVACDTVVFVLSEKSAGSPICHWEVEEAARANKRIIPVVPHEAGGVAPPPQLSELNYIYFFKNPTMPGSGFYDGVQKLERALKMNLGWLRRQTVYAEQAALWAADKSDDRVLGGKPFEEALQWRAEAPAGATVSPLVIEYLAAAEAVAARRKAEADANIAEREAALKRARLATTIGLAMAVALIVVASLLSWTATSATRDANENRAAIFANEADTRMAQGRYPEAMMIALAGDPASRRDWLSHFLAPSGHANLLNALAAATSGNRVEQTFVGHHGPVNGVSITDDGRLVATGSWDGYARVWDSATGRVVQAVHGRDRAIVSSVLSADGRWLVTSGDFASATLWDLQARRSVRRFEVSPFEEGRSVTTHSTLSADGARILAAAGNQLVLWDARSGAELRRWDIEGVGAVALSSDGALAMASVHSGATVWDTRTGHVVRSETRKDDNDDDVTTTAVALSRDGREALVGFSDGVVQSWGVPEGHVTTIRAGSLQVTALAFSHDGMLIATSTLDHTLKIWERSNHETPLFSFPNYERPIVGAAFSKDGKHIATAWDDDTARLFSLGDAEPEHTVRGESGDGVGLFSDGARIVRSTRNTANGPIAYVISDLASGRTLRQIPETDASEWTVSPDGTRILGFAYHKVLSLNTAGGGGFHEAADVHPGYGEKSLSRNGARIAFRTSDSETGNLESVEVWDLDRNRKLRAFDVSAPMAFSAWALSPDGRSALIAKYDNTNIATLYDVETGRVLHTFAGQHRPLESLSFSSDGQRVFGSTSDHVGKIWDANGRLLQTLGRTDEDLSYAVFSPDHALLLTSGSTTILWDVASGRELQRFNAAGRQLAFSADRRRIVVADDGVARSFAINPIFAASPDDAVGLACQALRFRGFRGYSDSDLARFPILLHEPRNPCAGVPPPRAH